MDGGEKEKAAAAEVRRDIKNSARREPAVASTLADRTTSRVPSLGQSLARHSSSQPKEGLANSVLLLPPQVDVP